MRSAKFTTQSYVRKAHWKEKSKISHSNLGAEENVSGANFAVGAFSARCPVPERAYANGMPQFFTIGYGQA
jgi:hypothetical protein